MLKPNCFMVERYERFDECDICNLRKSRYSMSHLKSEIHQKNFTEKLHEVIWHLSEIKKSPIGIHDSNWPDKDSTEYCHFCFVGYAEHYIEDEFTLEYYGSLIHYSSKMHYKLVDWTLSMNRRKDKIENYCVNEEDVDRYLAEIPDAKRKYLRKLDLKSNMTLPSSSHNLHDSSPCANKAKKIKPEPAPFYTVKYKGFFELSPFLKSISPQASTSGHQSATPGIVPTTLAKQVANQKKKRPSVKHVGATFKHRVQGSSTFLPP